VAVQQEIMQVVAVELVMMMVQEQLQTHQVLQEEEVLVKVVDLGQQVLVLQTLVVVVEAHQQQVELQEVVVVV
tara:strand:- start:14 stop:232 length:219 start_codon:yes stop_codon:yes gene_type:complete